MRINRLLGLLLVACAVLTTEIVLTRVFSVVMWYHFAFLAISIALFGLGLGGVAMHIFGRWLAEREDAVFAYAGAALGAANALAVWALLSLKLGGFEFDAASLLSLGLIYLLAALPFLAGGVFISLMLRWGCKHAGIVYLFDLLGAGLGCLLTIPLLNIFGGPAAVLVAGAMAAIGGLVAAGRTKPLRLVVGLAVIVSLLATVGVHLGTGGTMLEPRYVKGNEEPDKIAVGWNSFSRVIAYPRPELGDIMVEIDGIAHTPITPFNGDTAGTQVPSANLQRLPYEIRPGAKALIFGSGGGEHILTALDAGAKQIVGLEMNPIIVDWVDNRFADVAGGLFHYPGVEVVVDEGRSFIRRSREKFDLIQFTLIDTWAATAAGAFVLTENHVYTVESMLEYFDHLGPQGMLSFKRWREAEQFNLRLMALARAALEKRGVENPELHFFIVHNVEFINMLVKAEPFTLDEVADLVDWSDKLNLPIVYSPFSGGEGEAFRKLATAASLSSWLAEQSLDLSPPTDNQPFLFYTLRLRDLPQVFQQVYSARIRNIGPILLYFMLALVLVFVILLILVPSWLTREKGASPPKRTALYFAVIGLAYLLVEVAVMQKFILFLGHPTYALAVVLFTILISSSLGAALSERIYPDRAVRNLRWVVVGLTLYAAVFLVISPRLFHEALVLGIVYRIMISVALLVPLGLLMGVPFPLGVRLVGYDHPRSVPWMFAVNSAASVMGSVLAMLLAVNFGFTSAVSFGLVLYLIAGFLL
ncbi:MAG: hypothetical protein ACTSXZ_02625 [Alphaproteobacteria bacterium]